MPDYLYGSLFFTTSRLFRNVNRIAEEEFKKIGVPPTHGMLLLLLDEWKELTASELSDYLDIKPSTTTRLLDKLQKLNTIKRRSEGRFSYVSLTNEGMLKIREIQGTLDTLEVRYRKIVGTQLMNKQKKVLTQMSDSFHEEE